MSNRITLSVILLRRYRPLFQEHAYEPSKLFLSRMLHESSRRALTEEEAEQAIAGLNVLRGRV